MPARTRQFNGSALPCSAKAASAAELKKGGPCSSSEGTIKLDIWRGNDGTDRHGLSVAAFKCERTHRIGRDRVHQKKTTANSRTGAAASAVRPLTTTFRCGDDQVMDADGYEREALGEPDRVTPKRKRKSKNKNDKTNGERGAVKGLDAEGVSLDDFLAYMPQHGYIFVPSREIWPASSVNARLPPVVGPDGKPIPPANGSTPMPPSSR